MADIEKKPGKGIYCIIVVALEYSNKPYMH